MGEISIELPSINRKKLKFLPLVAFVGLVIATSYDAGTNFSHAKSLPEKIDSLIFRKSAHEKFIGEIYDLIKNNYWNKIEDEQLSTYFSLGSQQLGYPVIIKTKDKKGVENMVSEAMKGMDDQKKKEYITQLSDMILASLQPNGRSRLYTSKLEAQLRDTVQNIDKGTDLYKTLGVSKEASQQEIQQVFETKVDKLQEEEKVATGEAKEQIKQQIADANRAYSAVGDTQKRQVYDQTGKEPTVGTRFIRPEVLYVPIKRISPQTFEEFQREITDTDKEGRGNALILDLRGNIGGSIDLLPYFLGPFVGGPNQYAYDLYHKGEYTPLRTVVGWLPALVPYKNVVILTDGKTQSSAEVIAATLKKFNVGIVVGTKTKGWGTVERVFDLKTQIDPSEKYSVFLVHSITLRDDGQPIEGRGVDPTININDPTWEQQLFAYYRRNDLVEAVKEAL